MNKWKCFQLNEISNLYFKRNKAFISIKESRGDVEMKRLFTSGKEKIDAWLQKEKKEKSPSRLFFMLSPSKVWFGFFV